MAFDWKKTVPPREQILSGFVLLALLILFVRIFYVPTRDGNRELVKKMAAMELEKSALEKFTQALVQVAPHPTIVQTPSPSLEVLRGKTPSAAKVMTDLLAILSDRDFLQGLEVQALNYLPPKEETGYRKTVFTVKVSGPYAAAMHYIRRVQNLPVLLTVDSIDIESPGFQSEVVTLEMIGTLMEIDL